jgi:secreted trypsin-like serine protease
VHAGTTYFDSGEVMTSRTAIMHEFYDPETVINDIAIIVLPGQLFGESKFLNYADNVLYTNVNHFFTQLRSFFLYIFFALL